MSYFFTQLRRSIGVFFRTIRAFVSRKLMGVAAAVRRVTNFSRHATKAATNSLQDVVSAAQSPTGPSDYVETGRLFISKALIIRILLGFVALGLIVYFLVWPFVLSRFLTARFYEKDKRVADWSGRVIVYSDEKKTVPLYAGRLEKGVLQGEGRLYDSEGVLTYEGQLRDGERSGSGKEYENGVLVYEGQLSSGRYDGYGTRYDGGFVSYKGQYADGERSGNGTEYRYGLLRYEGQFLDDLYEGRGKLYENSGLIYDGSFSAGVPDGTGTAWRNGQLLYDGQYAKGEYEGRGKLYENGVLAYDGAFHAGVPDGTGASYYPNGRIAYQGQYLSGKPDGSGVAYGDDGSKLYEGGFAEGEYSGEGILYCADGGQIEASFLGGDPAGNVTWKKNGFLYYQGEWSDGVPSGFGTIYSKSGKVLYEGPFLGGTIDGHSLLAYSTEELRSALGESSVKNENDGTAFRIIAEELGLTVLCTFQNETADSRIYQIYLYAPEKGDWVSLLPGEAHTKRVQWPAGAEPERLEIQYIGQMGVNVAAGPYAAENCVKDGQRTTALYASEERDRAVLLTWENQSAIPQASQPGSGSKKDEKVKHLLDAMDTMINHSGIAAGTVAFFGGVNTDEALSCTKSADEAVDLADALIDFWEETERLHALEEIYGRNETLLIDAQNAAAKGLSAADTIKALQQEQLELNSQIDMAKTAIKRAELKASESGVTWLQGYALEALLVSFNPAEQDISGLVLFATAYAKAIGSETPATAIENRVKDDLLSLSDAYSASKLALARYDAGDENAESALYAYSMGLGSKTAWYDAMNALSRARIELCAAVADFSKQANHFNRLTGGWVSREFNWHKDVFEQILRAEILPEDAGETPSEEDGAEPPEEPRPEEDVAESPEKPGEDEP